MVLSPAAGEDGQEVATAETQIHSAATDDGALAERLTRDRIHRSLFGELTQAPTIGRYTFLKELGEGGMGVVCAAYDPQLDRKVAIKLTRALAAATAESRARILREAQAMARLSHPNVVQVYEVGELGDDLFVAMEFIDGVDLSRWLAAERRSWREVQEVFLAAGRGLAAAHAVGLVHRDFKPANVFIGADGRVLVGDFGLARVNEVVAPGDDAREPRVPDARMGLGLATPLTATGALLGTPAYMAPESFKRNVFDASSDLFGFSVALFEALYGVRPFNGHDVATLVRAILESDPTIPASAEVPVWLQRVVLRGLRKRPEERWPSMSALLDALAFDPAARTRGIRRVAYATSAVVASVVGFGWLAAEARERAAHEETAKVAAEASRDRAFAGLRVEAEHSQAEASRARDALRLAALRRFDHLGALEHVDDPTSAAGLLREVEHPEQLRGWRLSAVEALEAPIARAVLPGWLYVGFSADGERLVTQDSDVAAKVWRTDGTGAPTTLGAREGAFIGEVSVSPDGRSVAIGYRDGLVRVYPLDGVGAPIELTDLGVSVAGLQWRSDGSQLIVNGIEAENGSMLRRSLRLDLHDRGAARLDLPGSARFIPTTGLILADRNLAAAWGPVRNAGVLGADGEALADFADASRIEAAPSGDAVLVLTPRTLALHRLDGAALGKGFDHAPLLHGGETLASATFTPNGARAISTTSEDRIFVWDVASASLLREVDAPPPPEPGMLQWGKPVVVSPDSALFARGYDDRRVWVWDVEGHHAPMILQGHLHAVGHLAFSPDSRTLATSTVYVRGFSKTEGLQRERGDFDPTVRLWPIPAARSVTFSAYTAPTTDADLRWVSHSPWTPDGRALVLREGLTLRLVDAEGQLLAPPVAVPEAHEALREPIFTADGHYVIFESASAWVRWDLRDPSQLAFIPFPEEAKTATRSPREHGRGWANLSRDGEYVYYRSAAGDQVRVHAFATQALVRTLDHGSSVVRVEISPRSDRVLTVGKDHTVRVWSLTGDAAPSVLELEGDGLLYPLWSPDGEFAVIAAATKVRDEYAFHVWRPGESASAELRLTAPAVVQYTRVSPDGRHLAIVGRDDRVTLVPVAGELLVRDLDNVDSEPGKLDFSPDGAWLLSQGTHAVFVWSTATGEIVRVLRSPGRHLSLATFDPTGTRVLLGGRDGTLTITPFDPEAAGADLQARLRAATSYCYSYERRRVDLNEPPALAWAHFAECERAQGREPGEAPKG
ncbi:MAG: serine/threonine-protein kinase [Nannocystaceae bacterium]